MAEDIVDGMIRGEKRNRTLFFVISFGLIWLYNTAFSGAWSYGWDLIS
jgi:hypothetical protein